ncbi:helix-turn-helix transcriptional regulator [Spongiibacter sp. KMU-166]|uniref:Helix-turn-helix transcriptional regulator n=1 Tax=Spongiibacter thalassae TaxID=2721624 RepID=A0ABX1GHQ0_9GAMM|nr:helix-turn-helix transcriptional regulator [Spongiibacter thalassae]NKI18703.1 helix-turn-helix transcriptional regulator [Spongiibacter thalassae]
MDACIKACRELLDEISSQGSLKSCVVDVLIGSPGAFPSIEQVAKKLEMSTRSLRRKLQQEGTSYQDLLQEVRLGLAKQYLRDKLSVEQIAELLGYSETSAFSRAFKGWTGKAPQEFRA